MTNNFSSFQDEMEERVVEQGKKVVKNVVSQGKKIDPTTGKPVPSKKMLTQLNQQVVQLAQVRLKKVREELEKQRLKAKQGEQVKQGEQAEKTPPKDDIVQKTLKGSKSTGEFKGLIGG